MLLLCFNFILLLYTSSSGWTRQSGWRPGLRKRYIIMRWSKNTRATIYYSTIINIILLCGFDYRSVSLKYNSNKKSLYYTYTPVLVLDPSAHFGHPGGWGGLPGHRKVPPLHRRRHEEAGGRLSNRKKIINIPCNLSRPQVLDNLRRVRKREVKGGTWVFQPVYPRVVDKLNGLLGTYNVSSSSSSSIMAKGRKAWWCVDTAVDYLTNKDTCSKIYSTTYVLLCCGLPNAEWVASVRHKYFAACHFTTTSMYTWQFRTKKYMTSIFREYYEASVWLLIAWVIFTKDAKV